MLAQADRDYQSRTYVAPVATGIAIAFETAAQPSDSPAAPAEPTPAMEEPVGEEPARQRVGMARPPALRRLRLATQADGITVRPPNGGGSVVVIRDCADSGGPGTGVAGEEDERVVDRAVVEGHRGQVGNRAIAALHLRPDELPAFVRRDRRP